MELGRAKMDKTNVDKSELPRITIYAIPVNLKKAYQKWCVDQDVSMSEPLRFFIEWVVQHTSYSDVQAALGD